MSNTNYQKKTSIGGSALIEGVMMRGPRRMAMAVRKTDGSIDLSDWELPAERPWYKTTPIIRGVFNFIDSMKDSYQCLMKSADIAGLESEEPSGFEKKLLDLFGENLSKVFGGVAMILGMALAILLFMVLPTLLIGQIRRVIVSPLLLSLIEAAVKIGIFILYLFAISRMSDIRRVFEYHGAEHKTIACYEAGDELTPENAAKYTRFHPRCGTSFILIVIIVSVLVFSLVSWDNLAVRIALKLICLPLVVGIAYEIIKLAGRYNNFCTRFISAPGLWLQRLTTREPDSTQLEIAIAAMKPCIPENQDEDRW
ncbi:MAG: DUF1385 domain-containing protein [Oscillospiraceae bacterium]|nr:DUF1385 domain-containing protein [Oscillospiraceae bacterium]MCM0704139.1 DUF1385 domain-containing protein [Faecalicatena sp. BF-R-105]MDY3217717.1 DUF1385 domain-containing protein [Candidatus Fimivivens sp.]SFJ07778.1 Uncharacterized conserved protein YqhQ [Ruminococcaceae bacterium D5]GKH50842.1 membrane protein [Eubacteriales bacterium]